MINNSLHTTAHKKCSLNVTLNRSCAHPIADSSAESCPRHTKNRRKPNETGKRHEIPKNPQQTTGTSDTTAGPAGLQASCDSAPDAQWQLDLTWLKSVRTAVVDAGEGIAEVVG